MMNKKGEDGYGVFLFFIFLALIPMCNHAGVTSYDDCKEDCIELNYNYEQDDNLNKRYFINLTEYSEKEVNDFCYNQCRGVNDE